MCFDHDSRPPALPADRVLAPLAGGAGAEVLTLRSEDGTEFSAAFADTPSPSPVGVVIIPDVRGLYRFYAELAERFAEAGHAAVASIRSAAPPAPASATTEFDYMPHVKQTTIEGVQADVAACTAALRERAGIEHAVVVGFCFGAPRRSTRRRATTSASTRSSGSTGASWPRRTVRWRASSPPRSMRCRT